MRPIRVAVAASAAGLLLSGCASQGQRPTEEITRARTLVEQATEANAQRYAAADLDRAREKLDAAEDAAGRGEHEIARDRAAEAAADAELANARAASGEAQHAAEEVEKSIETLRRETERHPPASTATPPGQP